MAFDKKAALAAGYSEKEINEFLKDNPDTESEKPTEAVEPPPPITVIPNIPNGESTAATLLAGAQDVAIPVAAGGAGVYGAKKVYDLAKTGLEAYGNRPIAPTAMAQPAAQQVAGQVAQQAAGQAVVNGSPATATTATGRPLTVQAGGLASESKMAADAQRFGQIARDLEYAQQAARGAGAAEAAVGAGAGAQPGWMARAAAAVQPYLGTAARLGGGAALALWPSPLGKGEEEQLAKLRAREAYHRELKKAEKE